MANNGNLRDEDLFYISRFDPNSGVPTGTLYQITWEHIRRRALQPTDQLLVLSNGEYYHVAIGDYWSGAKTIDKDTDFFLTERRTRDQFLLEYDGLYYVQFEIPATVMWEVTGEGNSAGNANKFAFSYDITMQEFEGAAPKLTYPDGTQHNFVPGQKTKIESDQLGIYRLEGTIQWFQSVAGRHGGEVDFSLSAGASWAKATAASTQFQKFGERMFAGSTAITGIPAGLRVKNCKEMFRGVGAIDCSVETLNTSDVVNFIGTFQEAGHAGSIGFDNWDVEKAIDFTSCFRDYKGDEVPNSWVVHNCTKYQNLYTNAVNIVGPVTWTGTILNNSPETMAPPLLMVEMFAGCSSLIGPAHIPVLPTQIFNNNYRWSTNKMFKDCVSMVNAPVFANNPNTQPNAAAGTNAKNLNQAEFMFQNCHVLSDRSCREWKIGFELYQSRSMFENCYEFDADLSQWYMGGVQKMDYMFRGCKAFNTSLSSWRTGACTNYSHMFDGCEIYNQPMGEWRTRKAKNMTAMFANCQQFDQDITKWCVPEIPSKPTDFDKQTAFQDEDLKQPDWGTCDPYERSFNLVSGGTAAFFHGRISKDIYITYPDGRELEIKASNNEFSLKIDANGWYGVDGLEHFSSIRWSTNQGSNYTGQLRFADNFDVSNVSDFSKCFDGYGGMKDDANIGRWDVSKATNMHSMFRGCKNLFWRKEGSDYSISPDWPSIQGDPNCDISAWDMSKVTDMSQMFKNCQAPPKSAGNRRRGVPTWNWDTSNVTNMYEMFMYFSERHMPDVGNWDVTKVTNMARTMMRVTFETAAEKGDTFKPQIWGPDSVQLDRWDPVECVNFNEFFLNTTTAGQNNQGGDRGTGTWRTPKAKHMVRMFKDSYARDDLSDWCVPLIKSRPEGFSYLTKPNDPNGYLGGKPGWGTCAAGLYKNPLIAAYGTESRNIVQVGGEVDKLRDATTLPDPTWLPTEESWEVGDNADPDDSSWTDISGSSGPTLIVDAAQDGKYVRLRQRLTLKSVVTLNFRDHMHMWTTRKPFGTLATRDDTGDTVWMSNISQYTPPGDAGWTEYETFYSPNPPVEFEAFSNPIKVQPVPAGDVIVAVTWKSPNNGQTFKVSGEKTTAGKIYYEDGTEYDIGPGAFSHIFNITGVWVIESDDLTSLSFAGTTAEFSLEPTMSYMGSIVDASRMFEDCRYYTQSLDWWDTQYVTDMSHMFSNAVNYVGDVSNWDTTSVTDMSYMFNEAHEFDGDLSAWDVTNVTNMKAMFSYTRAFDQSLTDWDVSNVTDMSEMFWSARAFNASLKEWDVLAVENMARMFQDAKVFNENLYFWEPNGCTNMDYMFQGAAEMVEDISPWCVPLITELPEAFATGAGFQDDIKLQPEWGWCTPTDQRGVFYWYAGTQLSFRGNVVEAETIYDETTGGQDALFHVGPGDFEVVLKSSLHPYGAYSLPVGKITKLNFMKDSTLENDADFDFTEKLETPLCTDLSHFLEGRAGWQGQLENLTTGHVTNMHRFAAQVSNIDLMGSGVRDLDTSSCRDMSEFFDNCKNITGYAALKDWDTGRCENMASMFHGSKILDVTVGCEGWNTSRVRDMSDMFSGTRKSGDEWDMDLGFWDVANVTNMNSLFRGSSILCELANWETKNVEDMSNMFNTTQYNKDISDWCVPKITSLPTGFGGKSGWQLAYKPVWGTCPPKYISPLIRVKDREDGKKYSPAALPGVETVELEKNGELTYPVSKEIRNEYWEIREDISPLTWVKIPDNEIVNNSYAPKEEDVGKALRLVQDLWNPFELNTYTLRSNIIEISTQLPPITGFLRIKTLNDTEDYWDYPAIYISEVVDPNGKTRFFNSKGEVFKTITGTSTGTNIGDDATKHDQITDIEIGNLKKIKFGFGGDKRLEFDPRSDWSFLEDMSGMFQDSSLQRLSGFETIDTSKVTNMHRLFKGVTFLHDSTTGAVMTVDLSNWDTSKVTDMSEMFNDIRGPSERYIGTHGPIALTGLGSWNTSRVTNMSNMFVAGKRKEYENDGTFSFNFNIDNWNFSSVANASNMFGRSADEGSSWHVPLFSNISNVGSIFFQEYPNILGKDWSSLWNAERTFAGWQRYDGHIEVFNAPYLINGNYMFKNCKKFTANLNKWNTPKLQKAERIFENCHQLYGNFSGWCQDLVHDGMTKEYGWAGKCFKFGPLDGSEPLNNSQCPGEVEGQYKWKQQLLPIRRTCAGTDIISDGEIV